MSLTSRIIPDELKGPYKVPGNQTKVECIKALFIHGSIVLTTLPLLLALMLIILSTVFCGQ